EDVGSRAVVGLGHGPVVARAGGLETTRGLVEAAEEVAVADRDRNPLGPHDRTVQRAQVRERRRVARPAGGSRLRQQLRTRGERDAAGAGDEELRDVLRSAYRQPLD